MKQRPQINSSSTYGSESTPMSWESENKKNILRAVHFDRPEYIPMIFHINSSCWNFYNAERLKELMESHAFLFPKSQHTSARTELEYNIFEQPGKPFVDGWGCVWETTVDGIVGSVTKHPLRSWDDFENYNSPDPEKDSGKGPVDWNEVRLEFEKTRQAGGLVMGGLRHGHTFQTLVDIRGYENLLFDMSDGVGALDKLIEMVRDFNLAIVNRYLQLGAEWMCYPEDLGMQTGPMISPVMFGKYIKPVYEQLITPARNKGCVIHMHSDGHIHSLAEELIAGGVEVINLQDLVNGIEWIKETLAGRVCIDLDIDRQHITPGGTPEQIDALIRKEVEMLGSKEGGLMMIYGLYPGVPIENVKALMDAMERYAFYYSD
jgi:hypothetical protein